MDQRNCIKFCVKKINLIVQAHLKCWVWYLASLLCTEHKFNCGITSLRKSEKMSMTMLFLVARARQQNRWKNGSNFGPIMITIVTSLLVHFRRKMAQLCLWAKIRTKQWLAVGVSAFQCMRPGFLCPKCDNFACWHTRQKQNEFHLKRWFFFLPKLTSSISRSQTHLAKRCSNVHTIIFVRRKDKTNYLSNQTWAKCYHSRNKH